MSSSPSSSSSSDRIQKSRSETMSNSEMLVDTSDDHHDAKDAIRFNSDKQAEDMIEPSSFNQVKPINKTKKSATSSNKRKRRRVEDRKEQEEKWKQERYDKLLYAARKDLTKHAKQVRTFECQKRIRTLKKRKTDSDTTNTEEGAAITVSKEERELKSWKSLPLELVVDVAIRSRLGLIHLNPNWQQQTTTEIAMEKHQEEWKEKVSRVLQHKTMEKCLEQWNEKVTEYRRWCLQLSDRHQGGTDPFQSSMKRKQKSKLQTSPATSNSNIKPTNANSKKPFDVPTSMFCNLGESNLGGGGGVENDNGEDLDDGNHNAMSSYGPAAFLEENGGITKKNRRGQRARRAKALALEAKKNGTQYQSINWRPKEERKNTQEQQSDKYQGLKDNTTSNEKAPNSNEEQQHPSWAAKKAQQTGIVPFQGKKITF